MTASELVCFALLVLFGAFHGLHQWILIRRQHEQIVRLERMAIVRENHVAVENMIANDQNLERLGLPNQHPRREGMNLPRPIS